MTFKIEKERYRSKIREVVLGATKESGGTRGHTITVGGESTLPYQHYEGEMPHRPVVAMEVWDIPPEGWEEELVEPFKDVVDNPVEWAKKNLNEYKADFICVRLQGAHPDGENRSPEDCAKTVKDILEAVDVPLMVYGCGNDEKDNEVIPKVAEEASGENLLLGVAEEENHKSITAAGMVHDHTVVAKSPIDINICKQLNILINEMGQKLERIVIDPTIAALGYGIEYGYSIMERARMGALQGDSMLAMPMIGMVGSETWRAKESKAPADDFPGWGEKETRSVLWEAVTAAALLQAGMNIFVMRHPRAVELTQQNIDEMMQDNSY